MLWGCLKWSFWRWPATPFPWDRFARTAASFHRLKGTKKLRFMSSHIMWTFANSPSKRHLCIKKYIAHTEAIRFYICFLLSYATQIEKFLGVNFCQNLKHGIETIEQRRICNCVDGALRLQFFVISFSEIWCDDISLNFCRITLLVCCDINVREPKVVSRRKRKQWLKWK